MDERQTQIKEGAGLEESRVNRELIDFLSKWSTPFFLLITVVALGWWGWQLLEKRAYDRTDAAFAELSGATAGEANPQLLEVIASDYSDVIDVAQLARLEAANAYLGAVVRGVEPGALFDDEGELTDESSLIDDTERQSYLARAKTLYTKVVEVADDAPGRAVVAMNAAYGLAAIAESEGDLNAARSWYERAKGFAQAGGYTVQVAIADARLASLDELSGAMPTLPRESDIARLPQPEQPALPEGFDPSMLEGLGLDAPAVDPSVIDPAMVDPSVVDETLGEDADTDAGATPDESDAPADNTADDSSDDTGETPPGA